MPFENRHPKRRTTPRGPSLPAQPRIACRRRGVNRNILGIETVGGGMEPDFKKRGVRVTHAKELRADKSDPPGLRFRSKPMLSTYGDLFRFDEG